MPKSQKRYKPLSSKELQLYKKKTKDLEKNRDKITNACITSLRKRYDRFIADKERLETKTNHLNQYLKHKNNDDIIKVLRYWISDLSD